MAPHFQSGLYTRNERAGFLSAYVAEALAKETSADFALRIKGLELT